MKKKFAIFVLMFLVGGLVWAQMPLKDEFAVENQKRIETRKFEEEEMVKEARELGSKATKSVLADDTPGSTGLKLLHESSTNVSADDPVQSISYSLLKSFVEGKPLVTTIVSRRNQKETRYDFANYAVTDPGYVADPFWMRNDEVLVMKAGRYDYYNGYFLYAFDRKNRRLFRIINDELNNRSLLPSPSRRYMTYICGGGQFGSDTSTSDAKPLSLWIWDSVENKSTHIADGDDIQGSYSWTSGREIVYSKLEKRNGRMLPVSYVWNTATKKSIELMVDAQAPVFSPDKKHVIYSTSLDTTKDFSPENSGYVVKEVSSGSGAKTLLKRAELGIFSPNRQIAWSTGSDVIVSVLTKPTQRGHRVLSYNIHSKASYSWSIIKYDDKASLLPTSSNGDRVFIIREHVLGSNPNNYFDLRYSISSLTLGTGKEQTFFQKDNILGLSENSVTLSDKLLR